MQGESEKANDSEYQLLENAKTLELFEHSSNVNIEPEGSFTSPFEGKYWRTCLHLYVQWDGTVDR